MYLQQQKQCPDPVSGSSSYSNSSVLITTQIRGKGSSELPDCSSDLYTHTHSHMHTGMHTHLHMHTGMHTHTYVHSNTFICRHTHTCMHTSTRDVSEYILQESTNTVMETDIYILLKVALCKSGKKIWKIQLHDWHVCASDIVFLVDGHKLKVPILFAT